LVSAATSQLPPPPASQHPRDSFANETNSIRSAAVAGRAPDSAISVGHGTHYGGSGTDFNKNRDRRRNERTQATYTAHHSRPLTAPHPSAHGPNAPPTRDRDERSRIFQIKLDGYSKIEQQAMGIESATILSLHLEKQNARGNSGVITTFCIHLNDERNPPRKHNRWRPTSDNFPHRHFCGDQPNRLTYQLHRILARYIFKNPDHSFESRKAFVESALKRAAHTCLVCGKSVGRGLIRPSTCSKECSIDFRQSDLDVRLVDLIHDPDTIELLLTAVSGAALDKRLGLIVGLPAHHLACDTSMLESLWTLFTGFSIPKSLSLRIGKPAKQLRSIQKALNKLPPLDKCSPQHIHGLSADVEALVSFAATSYRGYLISALRLPDFCVPQMERVDQFILADSPRELEMAYRKHWDTSTYDPLIVYHGTTLSRLYSILREGLQVCSKTGLQINGAHFGSGIYSSNQIHVAESYADFFKNQQKCGWGNSIFHSKRVLLGCELAHGSKWKKKDTKGFHVVRDPSCILIRYVFLLDEEVSIPSSRVVSPIIRKAAHHLWQLKL